MNKMSVRIFPIYYEDEEKEAARIIADAFDRSISLIDSLWGLVIPRDCRLYVMTSWAKFLFNSAPWGWKLLLGLTLPLWSIRVRRVWAVAGGWAQRYGKRIAIGIKPPRLLSKADTSIGSRIFHQEDDIEMKVQSITCHEVVHAATGHLKLPAWLNEGIAMVTVDRFAGRPTVKRETLAMLESLGEGKKPDSYRKVRIKDEDQLVYLYVRGYWITRMLVDSQAEGLLDLLSAGYSSDEITVQIANLLDIQPDELWSEIDKRVLAIFQSDNYPVDQL
jgi:hypothetical protein